MINEFFYKLKYLVGDKEEISFDNYKITRFNDDFGDSYYFIDYDNEHLSTIAENVENTCNKKNFLDNMHERIYNDTIDFYDKFNFKEKLISQLSEKIDNKVSKKRKI